MNSWFLLIFFKKKGEWNGIIRDLIENKADLAMTSVKITTSRVDNIDFSVPFFETVNFTLKHI